MGKRNTLYMKSQELIFSPNESYNSLIKELLSIHYNHSNTVQTKYCPSHIHKTFPISTACSPFHHPSGVLTSMVSTWEGSVW